MIIQIDTREKQRAIRKILAEFDRRGVKHVSSKLLVGDYMSLDDPKLIVDRKQNLLELCSNVCQDLPRFRRELALAMECEIRLVILCEHGGGIQSLEDVLHWENPRLKDSPMAVSGERLYRILKQLEKTFGVRFTFCDKNHTGARILEILGNGAGTG